ncbi:MAG: nuclear transport factor 2 family protein [Pyrinomonadaceae bacterium]
MRKLFVMFAMIGAAFIFADRAVGQEKEAELVKIPLNNYIQGQATGNPEFIRKAFYKDARIMAFREGKVMNWDVEEFASRFTGTAAKDEAERKRKIESIDISGTAAIAKISLDYPTVKFIDYMALLKIDGEWKIVSKSFNAEPKTPPAK